LFYLPIVRPGGGDLVVESTARNYTSVGEKKHNPLSPLLVPIDAFVSGGRMRTRVAVVLRPRTHPQVASAVVKAVVVPVIDVPIVRSIHDKPVH